MDESQRAGQNRRAAGAIMGAAVGDALGAPYEFKPSQGITLTGTEADLIGGGSFGWEPGEWTDDTAMMIPELVMRASARWNSDEVVRAWRQWARTARDVGNQTRAVLGALGPDATTADAAQAACAHHESTGRSGGNGSLMRTAPWGIGMGTAPSGLINPQRALAYALSAREQSIWTHFDPEAGDACVLWSVMIHQAVTYGVVDVDAALASLPDERRETWRERLVAAASGRPGDFPKNGWVVHALQAAWAALNRAGLDVCDAQTATPRAFRLALQEAINAGGDTDTVAAITGALAGAMCGADSIPLGWQRRVHGWGGEGVVLSLTDLGKLALAARRWGSGDNYGPFNELRWERRVDYSRFGGTGVLVRHPHDDGVWLGGVGALDALPDAVDAVVSLCRVGTEQVPARIAPGNRVEVWLIDREAEYENPHLEFVMGEAADAVARLRASGKTVLLHCVAAESRTPAVAVAYAVRHLGVRGDQAEADVAGVLGGPIRNAVLGAMARGVGGAA